MVQTNNNKVDGTGSPTRDHTRISFNEKIKVKKQQNTKEQPQRQ